MSSSCSPLDECLGWREIAEQLGVSVRTAQQYEKNMGLPVRRVVGCKRGAVSASRHALCQWMQTTWGESRVGTPIPPVTDRETVNDVEFTQTATNRDVQLLRV